MTHQLKMLYDYNLEYRERFNTDLIIRDDDAIINEILKVIIACQRKRYFTIKMLSYRIVDNPIEIHKVLYDNEQQYIDSKKRKRENMYKYISLKDSDIKLLVVKYYTSVNYPNTKHENTYDIFETIIAVPKVVNKYYFRLMGNIYSPMYQIVDGSTYNNSRTKSKKDSVTLKLMFGLVRIYRNFIKIKDVNKVPVEFTLYVSYTFNKSINAFKFILAKLGLLTTIRFMGLQYIYIDNKNPESEDMYTFNKNDIYISCPKNIFDNDPVTQSFIATIFKSINRDTTYDYIFLDSFWTSSLGQDFGSFTVDKGLSICESFEGLYDLSTKDSINLPIEHKENMYCLFRWMIREFSNLKVKDNLDISTKKVRYAEYIASIYAMKISKGIHRISDIGRRATVLDIKKALNTDPMYLIYSVTKSTLVNYRNDVNDLDTFSPLKFTFKGISGIGENKKSTIPDSTRQINPEYIGRVGLDESSPSDPGLTGMLCPYVNLLNGNFSDKPEPLTWEEEYNEMIRNYRKLKGLKEILSFKENVTGIAKDKEIYEMLEDSINTFNELVKPIQNVKNTSQIITPISFCKGDE